MKPRNGLWLAGPLLVATVLRTWNLHNQPLLDDETALVRAVLAGNARELLWSFGHQDVFKPLAATSRLLVDLGVPLREWLLRVPSLAAGLLATVVLPLQARNVQSRAAACYAWLLSVSPLLVIYSRLARSYMPMALLATASAFALVSGIRTRDRRQLLWSGALAPLAIYCHIMAAPFLTACFLAAATLLAMDRSPEGRDLQRFFDHGLLLATTIALPLFVPSLPSFAETLAIKMESSAISFSSWKRASLYLGGTREVVVALLFWALAAVGLWRLGRQLRIAQIIFAAGILAQPLAIALLAPFGAEYDLVLSRYLLVILPVLLFLVAVALSNIGRVVPPRKEFALGLTAALSLFAAGPLPRIHSRDSSLLHDAFRLQFVEPWQPAERTLPPLLDTALLRNATTIGWIVPRLASQSFPELPRIDRLLGRRIVLVDSNGFSSRPGLDLRNSVSLDLERLRAADIDVLAMRIADFPFLREKRRKYYVYPALLERKRRAFYEKLIQKLGKPTLADETFALWKLTS